MTTYEILNQSDLSGLDYSQLHQSSEADTRLNNDSTEAVVCYDGTRPSTLSSITALTKDGRTEHTHAQILILMAELDSSGVTGWNVLQE